MSFSASSERVPLRSDDERRRGRRVALAILAICAAPTVAAWLAFFVWQPQTRTNYGELIEPRPLSDPDLRRIEGGSLRLSQLHGKWVLVQIDSAACGEDCKNKLVYMRQARLALGKDADRIERLWLVDDAGTPDSSLLREHKGLIVAHAPSGGFVEEFRSVRDADYIYVIDPMGNLMMRFPRHPDGRRMLKDLVRLLGASRMG